MESGLVDRLPADPSTGPSADVAMLTNDPRQYSSIPSSFSSSGATASTTISTTDENLRNDGNTVDLETEMTALTETQIKYSAVAHCSRASSLSSTTCLEGIRMSGLGAACVTIGATVGTLQGAIVSGSSQPDSRASATSSRRPGHRAPPALWVRRLPGPTPARPPRRPRPDPRLPRSLRRGPGKPTTSPRSGTASRNAREPDRWAGHRRDNCGRCRSGFGLGRTTGPWQELESSGRGRRVGPRLERLRLHVHGLCISCRGRVGRRRCGDHRGGRGFGYASAGHPNGWLRERSRGNLDSLHVGHRR